MSRPRDFAVVRKSDPHFLLWDGEGKASGAGFLRALWKDRFLGLLALSPIPIWVCNSKRVVFNSPSASDA